MVLWRISHYPTLDGGGGLYAAARWHSLGRRIVYFSESPAGALIEILVHLELDLNALPLVYRLMKVEAETATSIDRAEMGSAEDWKDNPSVTRRVGDSWLESRSSALLAVPSVVVPETSNWLFNPVHPDSQKLSVEWHKPFVLDKRLLRFV